MPTLLSIVGARPNFVKLAALYRAFADYPDTQFRVVHTGQHYDPALSEVFFRQLGLPDPDYHLGVGEGRPGAQLGQMLIDLEPIMEAEKPDYVLVVGDTTSTLAGALAGNRAGRAVVHVEAGLRSGDRSMPEEVNRVLVDALADYHFVSEAAGLNHLAREGVAGEKIFFAGNCMIDTLMHCYDQAMATRAAERFGLPIQTYAVVTLHRPSNVDHIEGWHRLLEVLQECCRLTPVIFPVHPRTSLHLERLGLGELLANQPNLIMVAPMGYFEFINLLAHAAVVVTDSGGIQEEATFLRVPCITYRTTTERPVTIEYGTNVLADDLRPDTVATWVEQALLGRWKTSLTPPLWDGEAAVRIADVLVGGLVKR